MYAVIAATSPVKKTLDHSRPLSSSRHMASRYIVGIDLGTTNCAVAYVDTRGAAGVNNRVAMFDIPQLTGPSEVKPLAMLPSFLYVPGAHDLPAGSTRLPWND